jgi:endonuclease-3
MRRPRQPEDHRRDLVRRVVAILDDVYGRPVLAPRLPALDELIYTVLSQNTADVNTDRSFATLRRRLPTWELVRDAPLEEVVDAIARGGLGRTKAPRIQAILSALSERTGSPSLDALADIEDHAALAYLQSLPGVGPKTASCVLLFALGRPVVPVDTHVHRVARRVGLIGRDISAERAHQQLTALAAPDPHDAYAVHIGLVRHGRRVCRARRPLCEQCVLAAFCASAGKPELW